MRTYLELPEAVDGEPGDDDAVVYLAERARTELGMRQERDLEGQIEKAATDPDTAGHHLAVVLVDQARLMVRLTALIDDLARRGEQQMNQTQHDAAAHGLVEVYSGPQDAWTVLDNATSDHLQIAQEAAKLSARMAQVGVLDVTILGALKALLAAWRAAPSQPHMSGVPSRPAAAVQPGELVEGRLYEVTHRSATQRRSRRSVMTFLGRDGGGLLWSARPVAGTQTMPTDWVEGIREVPAGTAVYLNRPVS